jgi:hypothetical protein
MRKIVWLVFVCAVAGLVAAVPCYAQKKMAQLPKMKAAKTAYFENRTGVDAVGEETLGQLKKWGRFQMMLSPKKADVLILLTADPYKGGDILLASGETGSMSDNGKVEKDPVPNYNKLAPTREAYLTVVETGSGDILWSESHVWGGLLTGVNSAGARLVKKLQKEMGK